MKPCEIREALEQQIEEAYKEIGDAQYERESEYAKGRAALSRLLSQKHSHERKHGCLKDSD